MPEWLIDSGLPMYPSGLSDEDANLVAPLYRAINAVAQQASAVTGSVQYSSQDIANLDPFTSLRSDKTSKLFVKASENLVYGHVVNLHVVSGELSARRADALLGYPAHGVVDEPAGIPSGQSGQIVFMTGRAAGLAGTVLGASYFLSTGGTVQSTPPTVDGVLVQTVGVGLDAGGIMLAIQPLQKVCTGVRLLGTIPPAAGMDAIMRHQFSDGSVVDITVAYTPPMSNGGA